MYRIPELLAPAGGMEQLKAAVENGADSVLKGFYQGDDRVVPVIPNITKGWHDHNIRKNFDKIVAASAKKGIAVGNLGWIELGIRGAIIAHEADTEDILGLDFHGIIPERRRPES